MSDQPIKLIQGMPTDRRLLDQLGAAIRASGGTEWKPSVEHSIMQCSECGRDVWVGPNQRQLLASVLIRTALVCILCLVEDERIREDLGIDMELDFISTNMDTAKLRRRY